MMLGMALVWMTLSSSCLAALVKVYGARISRTEVLTSVGGCVMVG